MVEILVPIFVCVVLPVAIVLIISLSETTKEKLKANIIIKAIEANNNIDADKLAESLKKPVKTGRQILNSRLLRGCIFSLVGLFLCIVGIVNLCNGIDFSAYHVTAPFIFGGASIAIGVSFLIVYFVTRKQVDITKEK